MRDNKSDDLRMFPFDHLRDGARIHPLQDLDALGAARWGDAGQHAARLVLTKRLDQHAPDIGVGAQAHACLRLYDGEKFIENHIDRALINLGHRVHRASELLNLARAEVLHDLRSLVLAQEQHQDRAFLRS